MFKSLFRQLAAMALALCLSGLGSAQPVPPPDLVPREFRAAWVATVSNIDWPSSRNRTTAQQQAELIAILDTLKNAGLNAAILQIRPECDALYPSTIEPWSHWLTGQQGRAPNPIWDPLQFAIDAAHARNMELHAWMNPYRARNPTAYTIHSTHIIAERPDLVRDYGTRKILDPGEPEVPAYLLSVVRDVIERYDVDGIHFDDYFYPYPETGLTFPDQATYQTYLDGGGSLSLANWRRKNVSDFIRDCHAMIKEVKPGVKFGLSPFGIWRPGNPPGVTGLDAYNAIYGDSKLWLNSGWVDYFTPQLYWSISPPQQSYTALLDWWISQNTRGRHIWPGLGLYRIGQTSYGGGLVTEITDQIAATRLRPGATGNVFFSMSQLSDNTLGSRGLIAAEYASRALIPASTWLDNVPPAAPTLSTTAGGGGTTLEWSTAGADPLFAFVVYIYRQGAWEYQILPATAGSFLITGAAPEFATVTAVDRLGNESLPGVPPLDVWMVR